MSHLTQNGSFGTFFLANLVTIVLKKLNLIKHKQTAQEKLQKNTSKPKSKENLDQQ